jgi:hypothetical protein
MGIVKCGYLSNIYEIFVNIICIKHKLEKKWGCNFTANLLFIDFDKAYYSVRTEELYNILT